MSCSATKMLRGRCNPGPSEPGDTLSAPWVHRVLLCRSYRVLEAGPKVLDSCRGEVMYAEPSQCEHGALEWAMTETVTRLPRRPQDAGGAGVWDTCPGTFQTLTGQLKREALCAAGGRVGGTGTSKILKPR